jgi:hypothetical protein
MNRVMMIDNVKGLSCWRELPSDVEEDTLSPVELDTFETSVAAGAEFDVSVVDCAPGGIAWLAEGGFTV